MQGVSQLVDELAEPRIRFFNLVQHCRSIPLQAECGHGIGNGVVETAIQCPELVDGERCVALDREVGDRLAQVAVVVHHLVHAVAQGQQLPAVRCGTDGHLAAGGRACARGARDLLAVGRIAFVLGLQRLDELIQEQRNAIGELRARGRTGRPLRDLGRAARDQLISVAGQKTLHAKPL
jgi:hypothetical protein